MGIVQHLIGPQADLLEQLGDALTSFAACRQMMDEKRLTHDVARGHARVERSEWVLENDLHGTPMRTQFGFRKTGDIATFQPDGAAGRLDEAQNASRNR